MTKLVINKTDNGYEVFFNNWKVGDIYYSEFDMFTFDPSPEENVFTPWLLRKVAEKLDELNESSY